MNVDTLEDVLIVLDDYFTKFCPEAECNHFDDDEEYIIFDEMVYVKKEDVVV